MALRGHGVFVPQPQPPRQPQQQHRCAPGSVVAATTRAPDGGNGRHHGAASEPRGPEWRALGLGVARLPAAGAAARLPPGRTWMPAFRYGPPFCAACFMRCDCFEIFGARFARHPCPPPLVRQGLLGGVRRGMGVQGSEWGGHTRTRRTPRLSLRSSGWLWARNDGWHREAVLPNAPPRRPQSLSSPAAAGTPA